MKKANIGKTILEQEYDVGPACLDGSEGGGTTCHETKERGPSLLPEIC